MHNPNTDGHGAALVLAQSEAGAVTTCTCGVVTVTLQYLSLRFEPAAFRELQGLFALAQHRLDSDPTVRSLHRLASADAPPVH